MSSPTILFVCEHGSAKSVVAAAHFNRLAAARGLKYRAVCRGTDPDANIHPVALSGLIADHVHPPGDPRLLTCDDLLAAHRVIVFGELPPDLSRLREVESWCVPPVSEDYGVARAAIVERLIPVVAELAESDSPG